MRKLLPEFIVEQAAAGNYAGSLPAVCLFVDISGFTPLTAELMQAGPEGAEVIAGLLATIFEPMLAAVYARGGFVAGFAGDAFKAIFPLALPQACHRAAATAWQQRAHLHAHAIQGTRFGVFTFSAKITLAAGAVDWQIWTDNAAWQTTGGQHAACCFAGEAIQRAMQMDTLATTGEIVLTDALRVQIAGAGVELAPVADCWRLTQWPDAGSPAATPLPSSASENSAYVTTASAFFPQSLLESPVNGEFRRVVSAFVNLPATLATTDHARWIDVLFVLLNRHRGYLCRIGRIGGKDDGLTLLIFFGAPASYEHDVENALEFLLDLRTALSIPFRAGVTTNLAFAGFIGSQYIQEYTCHGPYVNLAARAMVAAPTGVIWLDAETARHARSEYQVEAVGDLVFKGFSQPQKIALLIDRRAARDATTPQTPLVGRSAELTQMEHALHPVVRGRFGGALAVVGEPGLGKTRLVLELRRRMAEIGAVNWWVCQTDENIRTPLNPFRYALRQYFNLSVQQREAANQAQISRTLVALRARTVDPDLAAGLEHGQPFLYALLDLSVDDPIYQQMDARLRSDNTLDAIKTLIKAESLQHPLVIQIEDAQWLDAETTHFLTHLTNNVEGFPFALILATRPEGDFAPDSPPPSWLAGDLLQATIVLAPLDATSVAAIAENRIGGKVDPSVIELLARQAEGVPFFVEQLLLYLQEQGSLVQDGQSWKLAANPRGGQMAPVLPDDVRGVLTARLDQLPLRVKLAIQTASVLGREFDVRVLARMLAVDGDLTEILAAAARAAIWTAVADLRYSFQHALLRDAAYAMQLRARLRQLHQAAAAAIEGVYTGELAPQYASLVYHFHEGEDPAHEGHYAQLAGDYAASQFANQDALRFLTRALDLTAPEDNRRHIDLLFARERVYHILGDRNGQEQDLRQLNPLLAASNDAQQRLQFNLRSVQRAGLVQQYAQAASTLAEAMHLAEEMQDVRAQAECYRMLGRILVQQGKYREARAEIERALELLNRLNQPDELAATLFALGIVFYYEANYADAFPYMAQAHRFYVQAQDREGEANSLRMMGVIEHRRGHYTEAKAHYDAAIAISHTIGWRQGEAYLLGSVGNMQFMLGDFTSAQSYHEAARQMCRELQDREGEGASLDTLGLAAHAQGKAAVAAAYYRSALQIQEGIGDQSGVTYTLTHLGYLDLEGGDTRNAEALFQRAVAIRRELGDSSTQMDSLAGLALALAANGKPAEALALVDQILTWTAANGVENLEFPAQVAVACHHLTAADPVTPPQLRARVQALVGQSWRYVQGCADQIQDPEQRRTYLEQGLGNRELAQLWQRS